MIKWRLVLLISMPISTFMYSSLPSRSKALLHWLLNKKVDIIVSFFTTRISQLDQGFKSVTLPATRSLLLPSVQGFPIILACETKQCHHGKGVYCNSGVVPSFHSPLPKRCRISAWASIIWPALSMQPQPQSEVRVEPGRGGNSSL